MPGSRVMLDFISTRDHRLMRRVHRWPAPRWVQVWMLASTRGGDGWLWLAFTLLILLFGDGERYAALAASGIASAVGIALFLSVKRAADRKRPCALEPHCWATLLPPDRFSFPSGHTITAFAVTTPLGLFYPTLQPMLLFCAGSVAASRVVLGMHFLSDVVVGTLMGASLGYAAYLYVM